MSEHHGKKAKLNMGGFEMEFDDVVLHQVDEPVTDVEMKNLAGLLLGPWEFETKIERADGMEALRFIAVMHEEDATRLASNSPLTPLSCRPGKRWPEDGIIR
jgi:hypothetical protein